jgi:Uma2 family endonuclease
MSTKAKATIEDLYHVPENGKAEIVRGRLVMIPLAGWRPGRASGAIFARLYDYEHASGKGEAFMGNIAFVMHVPELRTFSPDAAFFRGKPTSAPGKFIDGAPIFAAEVRSEGDYGRAAERDMTQKRADYFKAGTKVVWDVDVLKDMVVRVYRADDQENPKVYGRDEVAEAEPALPGWTMPVEDLFQ